MVSDCYQLKLVAKCLNFKCTFSPVLAPSFSFLSHNYTSWLHSHHETWSLVGALSRRGRHSSRASCAPPDYNIQLENQFDILDLHDFMTILCCRLPASSCCPVDSKTHCHLRSLLQSYLGAPTTSGHVAPYCTLHQRHSGPHPPSLSTPLQPLCHRG